MQRSLSLFQAIVCAAGVTSGGASLFSQTAVNKPLTVDTDPQIMTLGDGPKPQKEITATWKTEKQARAITVSIPAPRGQIVDRHGVPLAQNRVANYLALTMPFLGNDATDEQIVGFARRHILAADQVLGKKWMISNEKLLQHYKNRRWLPMVFSINDRINEELSADDQEKIKPLLKSYPALALQPVYIRFYPNTAFAAHVIGYIRKVRPLPVGPVEDGQPLFEETEGVSGLEKSFDKDLQGRPGSVNTLFDADGSRIKEETLHRPIPGNNVVTTLDYNLQKYTENALARHTKSSAMVIMDVHTGEILAMASYPSYDLNLFIPGITNDAYERLNNDPTEPLQPRSFAGTYPPASTFKVVVSEAALETGKINGHTAYDGAPSIWIGDHQFHNWSKEPEGMINVVTALKRSCNTWFYQCGLAIGAKPILEMANRLGFGEKTGIPLDGESSGFIPSDAWTMQKFGHKMLGGDIANLSIGQGSTLVTPLQAAQAMAAVADGKNMPQPILVKQIQNGNDQVVQVFPPSVRRVVSLKPESRAVVLKGMIAVVSGDSGTGHSGALDQAQVAAKTGTAQWKMKDEKRHIDERGLAWFTGFLPAEDPQYAFAMVYEGQPGELVHGGANAGPVVHEVFDNFFKNASPDQPVLAKAKEKPSKKAVDDDDSERTESANAPRAEGVQVQQAVPVAAPKQPDRPTGNPVGGFFHRLFFGR